MKQYEYAIGVLHDRLQIKRKHIDHELEGMTQRTDAEKNDVIRRKIVAQSQHDDLIEAIKLLAGGELPEELIPAELPDEDAEN